MNQNIDQYLNTAKKWQVEIQALRKILLDSQLIEEWKWKQPCYTFQKNNVAILFNLKDSCGISFFKGGLLKDIKKVLVKPGENSQSVRLIKFTDVKKIVKMEPTLRAYLKEAIDNEKAGLSVDFKEKNELILVEELQNFLKEDTALKAAFEALTPGRQRAYNLYFAAPKQSQTRITRVQKYIPRILSGKGINDCTCGHSKRMPNCDGSHKYLNLQ